MATGVFYGVPVGSCGWQAVGEGGGDLECSGAVAVREGRWRRGVEEFYSGWFESWGDECKAV